MSTPCLSHHMQEGSAGSTSDSNADYVIEPLPGLETIVEELQREDGYNEINDFLSSLLNLEQFMVFDLSVY